MTPDPRTRELLLDVADGGVSDVFVVYRLADGRYGSCYRCDDANEMLYEVRTAAINMRARCGQGDEG